MTTRISVSCGFTATVATITPTWTDITRYVEMTDDSGVKITRGAEDERSKLPPGTCTITLDNSDGRFTSGRSASPYYPLRKNIPLRVLTVTATKNLVTNPTFEVNVADWFGNFPSVPERARSTVRAWEGTASMLITWTDFTPLYVYTQLHGLTIGAVHTASAYVWVPVGGPVVYLEIAGVATGTASSVTGAWQRLTVTFTSTFASHDLRIVPVGTPVDDSQTWVDAVQVEEGATATTFDAAAARVHPRFWGAVNEWPVTWEGLYSLVTITATDAFKRLAQPARHPMVSEEMLLDGALAYYPLSEPEGSGSVGDLTGTGAGALTVTQVGVGGTLAFGDGTGPGADGLSCPLFTPASTSNGLYLVGDLGNAYANNTLAHLGVEAWFATSTTGRVLIGMNSADNLNQLALSLDGTGALVVETTNGSGGGLTSVTVATGNLANGLVHHLLYDEVDGVWVDGSFVSLVGANHATGARILSVGGYKNTRLWNGSIAHVGFYRSNTGVGPQVSEHYQAGKTGCAGEAADVRLARLASYAGLTVTTQGAVFDDIASQGELGSSALDHLQDVETTESGHLLASRSASSLIYQARDVRYNPVSAVTLDYADTDTSGVSLADDDQKLINTVTAGRPGGATQRILDAASRAQYGVYEQALSILKNDDLAVAAAARWTVYRYADPGPELRQIPVEAYTLPLATYRALLDADVSTVATITGLPDEADAAAATVFIEGYTETILQGQHRLDFRTSRAGTDTVWILGDPTYSVLGQTTRIAY